MVRYYELLSDVDLAGLQKVRDGVAHRPDGMHPMESKKALAHELVARFHGRIQADRAAEEFVQQFKQKEVPEDIPVFHCQSDKPVWVCSLLASSGTVTSNAEARRLIQQGAVKLNGEKLVNVELELAPKGEIVLQAGKRKFVKVVFGEN